MNPEMRQNPEIPEKTKLSLRNIIEKLTAARRKVEDGIIEALNVQDPEIEGLMEEIKSGDELARRAGSYFRYWSVMGSRKVEKEYEHREPEYSQKREAEFFRTEALRYKIKKFPFIYDRIKKRYADFFFATQEAQFEERQEDNYKRQDFRQQVFQDQSNSLIQETVVNYLDDEASDATAFLRLSDLNSHKVINFGYLLPKGVKFVPAPFGSDIEELYVIQAKETQNINPDRKDLRGYRGTQTNEDMFALVVYPPGSDDGPDFMTEIRYGNLTETGGLLSLLHEIAHSWQEQYYEEYGKGPYKKKLAIIRAAVSDYLSASLNNDEVLKNRYQSILEREGVELKDDKDLPSEAILQDLVLSREERVYAKDHVKYREYVTTVANQSFTSQELVTLLEDYVDQERNAWANAIRVLRFFRRQGVDLEPNLKTLADFKKYVHPFLGSYDTSVTEEDLLTPPNSARKFVRPRKPDPDL